MLFVAYNPIYAHPLPDGHRFPMLKYELIPGQLLHEGVITTANILSPEPLTDEEILYTHSRAYWDKMRLGQLSAKEMRAIGFPQSAELVKRETIICRGTIDCALKAIQHGVALNVAGGTHHAFRDRGEGFCLLNDFAIACNHLLNHHLAKKILVTDLDVHQGNGTASIFANENRVFTFSMHGKHNYPFHKEKSDLDIELDNGTTGLEYLQVLEKTLSHIVEEFKPDFLCYVSGVDVLKTDKFGKMELTLEECMERDNIVFSVCRKRSIPIAVAMGGGYSPDIRDIVTAHCNTFKIAKQVFDL